MCFAAAGVSAHEQWEAAHEVLQITLTHHPLLRWAVPLSAWHCWGDAGALIRHPGDQQQAEPMPHLWYLFSLVHFGMHRTHKPVIAIEYCTQCRWRCAPPGPCRNC